MVMEFMIRFSVLIFLKCFWEVMHPFPVEFSGKHFRCESNKGTSEARGRAEDATLRSQTEAGQQFDSHGVNSGTNGAH